MKIIFICIILRDSFASKMKSGLSTFHTGDLCIESPPPLPDILDEGYWIMRSYFLHKNKYTENDWMKMKQEMKSNLSRDVHTALSRFLERFGDPYTRFIPHEALRMRHRNIRGETFGVGLSLRRQVLYRDINLHFRRQLATIRRTVLQRLTKIYQLQFLYKPLDSPDLIDTRYKQPYGSKLNVFRPWKFGILRRLRSSRSSSISASTSTVDTNIHPISWLLRALVVIEITGPILTAIGISRSINHFHPNLASHPNAAAHIPLLSITTSAIWSGYNAAKRFAPIVIRDVLPGSSAHNAGLQFGDRVVAIDGRRVWTMTVKAARAILENGAPGSTVNLAVVRNRMLYNSTSTSSSAASTSRIGHLIDIPLQRDWIAVDGVRSRILPGDIGYLAISLFTDRTANEVSRHLQRLQNDIRAVQSNRDKLMKHNGTRAAKRMLTGMQALVIDLRGNPGGTLASAVDVATYFVNRYKVVLQMKSMGKTQCYTSLNKKADTSTAMLVLTDSDTASASEVLVAALKDHGRAVTMGETTVGKDVVQAMMMLSDGSGLTVTIRSYLSPLGRTLSDGISPDLPVSSHKIVPEKLRFDSSLKKWSLQE